MQCIFEVNERITFNALVAGECCTTCCNHHYHRWLSQSHMWHVKQFTHAHHRSRCTLCTIQLATTLHATRCFPPSAWPYSNCIRPRSACAFHRCQSCTLCNCNAHAFTMPNQCNGKILYSMWTCIRIKIQRYKDTNVLQAFKCTSVSRHGASFNVLQRSTWCIFQA